MDSLLIWNESRVWKIDQDNKKQWTEAGVQTCRFKEEGAELVLDSGDTSVQIPYGTIKTCKYRMAVAYQNIVWIVFPLTESQTIGRSLLQMPSVSARHFSIVQKNGCWFIEDLDSSNGTFLNGERVFQSELKTEDWIFAGGISCLFLDGLLLIQKAETQVLQPQPVCSKQKCKGTEEQESVYKNLPVCSMPVLPGCGTQPLIVEVIPERTELEPPSFSGRPEKRSIAQAAGPALMILCSSLASSAAVMLGSAQSFSPSMLLSPVFMAAAFGGYGLFNRKLQKDTDVRRRKEEEKTYLSYLSSCHLQASAQMRKRAQEWTAQKEELLDLDWKFFGSYRKSEDWVLPAGTDSVPAVVVKEPRIGYQSLSDPITEEINRISAINYAVPVWKTISKGSVAVMNCGSKEHAERTAGWMFALWSWLISNPQRKFVWIGGKPSVPRLPGWMLDGKELHFKTVQDWQQYSRLYPQIEWTLCLSGQPDNTFLEESSSAELPNPTWICFPELSEQVTAEKNVSNHSVRSCAASGNSHISSDSSAVIFSNAKLFEKKSPDWKKVRMSYMERSFTPALEQDDWRVHHESLHCSAQADLQVHPGPGVCWNLDEDGPHILAAGTTGSGKSEGLLTLLMELVLKNTAQQVQLILVDFKGGAFAGPFEQLPHLAGLVTNLDQGAVGRLIEALEHELTERQKKIAQWASKNSSQTADLKSYNMHNPNDFISHLFVVIDEFAQMKTRYPESMQQLQEAARIGRSLGLHLILCTQKPSGIVDEQIWSNTRSKICFQVAGKSDSREMFQSDQAALLKQPGEFILMTPGRPLQKSRSFYLRSPMKGRTKTWIENETGSVIYRPEPGMSWLEKLQDAILARKEERRWILFPDPACCTEILTGPVIDCISHTEPWHIPSSENLLIAARREETDNVIETLCRMLKQENQSVYLWNSQSNLADQILTIPGLWMLSEMQCQAAVILAADTSLPEELLEKLCACPGLTVIAVFDEAGRLLEKCKGWFGSKAAAGLIDRDLRYALFETVSVPLEAWPVMRIQSKADYLRVIFPVREEKIADGDNNSTWKTRKKKIVLPALELDPVQAWDLPFGFIGIAGNTQRPVFWKGQKPLLVMYSGQNGKLLVEGLMDFWLAQDPLCQPALWPEQGMIALCCLEDAASNPGALKACQDECDLLYLGTEFSLKQFQTGIKALLCQEGNGVFQSGQEVFDLKITGLKKQSRNKQEKNQEKNYADPYQYDSFTGHSPNLY